MSDLLVEISHVPWWVGVGFAALAWGILGFVVPSSLGQRPMEQMIGSVSVVAAPWFALLFVLAAVRSAFRTYQASRLHAATRSLDDLRALDWRQFEALVGEAYRRDGYRVRVNEGAGADGGVDVELYRDGRTTVVQAKRWRTRNIGVGVVRELFGAMHARGADRAVVVGSGGFTRAAIEFARSNAVELVDGSALLALVVGVDVPKRSGPTDERALEITTRAADRREPPVAAQNEAPECEACRSPMKLRRRRGAPASVPSFWGCSKFPACRHTKSV